MNLLLDLVGAHVVAKISPHLPELMKDPSVLDLLQVNDFHICLCFLSVILFLYNFQRVKSVRTGTCSEYATRQLSEHVSKLGRSRRILFKIFSMLLLLSNRPPVQNNFAVASEKLGAI